MHCVVGGQIFTWDWDNGISTEGVWLLAMHCGMVLTLYLLTWRIWWAPNNASKGQVGLNSAFKGLILKTCNCWPAVLCACTIEWHNAQTVNVNNITKNWDQPQNAWYYEKKKLRGLSPRANYTDRAAAAGRRSWCQLLRVEGCHVVSATGPHGR